MAASSSEKRTPRLVLLSGPNGSGKSTIAPKLLKGALAVSEFVNADTIAQGLSAFESENVAFQAGRVMLSRIKRLSNQGKDFAFETTLSSRSFVPWIKRLCEEGYSFHLIYLWLPSPEAAISRVAERARLGGHDVPEETIRRRYRAGIRNFFVLYRPLASTWRFYDNASRKGPILIAAGTNESDTMILDSNAWELVKGKYHGC